MRGTADDQLEGGAWNHYKGGIILNGSTADGTAKPGPCAINCNNDGEVYSFHPSGANAVFAELPENLIRVLWERGWMFYTFVGKTGCRLMCAWDTSAKDIDEFVADINDSLRERMNG